MYGYQFQTESTGCLFVRVYVGNGCQNPKEVCNGYVRRYSTSNDSTGANLVIPDSLCTPVRLPANSEVYVSFEYGAAPESSCSATPPQSQCTDCSTTLDGEIFSSLSRTCEAHSDFVGDGLKEVTVETVVENGVEMVTITLDP